MPRDRSCGVAASALLAGLAGWLAAAPASAEPACLSSGDATEAVSRHTVVTPTDAIVIARREVPNADILRAALCREPEALVYRITALRRDGRLVRVTVDAPSGKVKGIH